MFNKQSVSPCDIVSLLSYVLDSCHSWFPEEGTAAQVHVLKCATLSVLLTTKCWWFMLFLLLRWVLRLTNSIKVVCLDPTIQFETFVDLTNQELSLPGSAVESRAVGEDTDVNFLKAYIVLMRLSPAFRNTFHITVQNGEVEVTVWHSAAELVWIRYCAAGPEACSALVLTGGSPTPGFNSRNSPRRCLFSQWI